MIRRIKDISIGQASFFVLLLTAGALATFTVGVGWIGYVLTIVAGGLLVL